MTVILEILSNKQENAEDKASRVGETISLFSKHECVYDLKTGFIRLVLRLVKLLVLIWSLFDPKRRKIFQEK